MCRQKSRSSGNAGSGSLNACAGSLRSHQASPRASAAWRSGAPVADEVEGSARASRPSHSGSPARTAAPGKLSARSSSSPAAAGELGDVAAVAGMEGLEPPLAGARPRFLHLVRDRGWRRRPSFFLFCNSVRHARPAAALASGTKWRNGEAEDCAQRRQRRHCRRGKGLAEARRARSGCRCRPPRSGR